MSSPSGYRRSFRSATAISSHSCFKGAEHHVVVAVLDDFDHPALDAGQRVVEDRDAVAARREAVAVEGRAVPFGRLKEGEGGALSALAPVALDTILTL